MRQIIFPRNYIMYHVLKWTVHLSLISNWYFRALLSIRKHGQFSYHYFPRYKSSYGRDLCWYQASSCTPNQVIPRIILYLHHIQFIYTKYQIEYVEFPLWILTTSILYFEMNFDHISKLSFEMFPLGGHTCGVSNCDW